MSKDSPPYIKQDLPGDTRGLDDCAPINRLQKILATVSHDLRQPLQTMGILHGILAAKTKDEEILKIVVRLEKALESTTSIVNALIGRKLADVENTAPKNQLAYENEPRNVADAFRSIGAETERASTIFIIDDDVMVREGLGELLQCHGHSVELFESGEQFLSARKSGQKGCLLVDAMLPGMTGLELLMYLEASSDRLPSIMITGCGDIAMAVQAMKAGAADFIEKPISSKDLLPIVARVLQSGPGKSPPSPDRDVALSRLSRLSPRERQIMNEILEGLPNKNIASDLGISQRTVEVHRANIMKKMGVKTLTALLKLALAAS